MPCPEIGATIALPLPLGNDRTTVAVWASHTLKVGDRVRVETSGGTPVPVVNVGTGETIIGTDAVVGALRSVAAVFLRERATVAGLLQTAGSVTTQNGVTIQGPVSEQHEFEEADDTPNWSVFAANEARPAIHLEPNQQVTLEPGVYGALRVAPGAKVFLTSGKYSFDSMTLETNSEVHFATDEGAAFVDVFESFTYRGRFVKTRTAPKDVLVSYLGTETAWLQAPFEGTLVAPDAKIDVVSVNGTPHRGSFFGREVELHSDARIIHLPFPWEEHDDLITDSAEELPEPDYPTSTGAPPSLSGAPVEEKVLTFLDWFYMAVKGDLPAIITEIGTVRGNDAIAEVLITEFERLRYDEPTRARMVLSVLGELRSTRGEDFFVDLLHAPLPERVAPLSKHGTDAREIALSYQRKAVHGLGYMMTDKSNLELRQQAIGHQDLGLRAEVVRTYIFKQPESVKADVPLTAGRGVPAGPLREPRRRPERRRLRRQAGRLRSQVPRSGGAPGGRGRPLSPNSPNRNTERHEEFGETK